MPAAALSGLSEGSCRELSLKEITHYVVMHVLLREIKMKKTKIMKKAILACTRLSKKNKINAVLSMCADLSALTS